MIRILHYVFRNLKRRKLRNWLTIAGIIVGVVAIVSLISLSEGLKVAITDEFDNLGSQKITITSKYQVIGGGKSSQGLRDEDIKNIEKIVDVDYVTGSLNGYLEAKYNQTTVMVSLTSYDPKYIDKILKQENKELLKGNYFATDKSKEIVVGYNYVNTEKTKDLFKRTIDIGTKIKLSGTDYTVVGILKNTGDFREDNAIYISNENLKEITKNETYDVVYAINKNGKDIETTSKKIKERLEKKRGSKDINVTTPLKEAESREEILGVVSIVIIGIACISLLVGGIGILNSMYTSVFERKKEIGILKAIGARKKDILMIFLLESGIIGLIGGIFGVIIGFGLAILVKFVALQIGITINILISFNIIILALSFSFIIGVISGTIPAYLASNQEPVEALREE